MKKALIYAAALCGISWIAALVFHLTTGFTGSEGGLDAIGQYRKFAMFYMFLPAIVALIFRALEGKGTVSRPHALRVKLSFGNDPMLKFRPRWSWLVGILIVPAWVALSIAISSLFAEVVGMKEGTLALAAASGAANLTEEAMAGYNMLTDGMMLAITLISGLFAGLTINALFTFGEEYGWRAYMVDALRGKKFLPSALLIGLVWGLWHFPLILMGHNNYPNRPVGVAVMVLFCVLAGIVELYFVCKSGTMWPAVFIHGVINAIAGIGVIMIPAGNTLLTGMTGLAGAGATLVVIALLWLYDRHISRDNIFGSTLGHSLNRANPEE